MIVCCDEKPSIQARARKHASQYVDRLKGAWPNLTLVRTPVHASWLDQAEIHFSILQRKALQRNNFADLETLEQTLLAFGRRYVKSS